MLLNEYDNPAVGTRRIPSGSFHLDGDLDDAIRVAAAAPARDGASAHPIFAFVIAVGGMGATVSEICTICDLSIEAGPLLAKCRIRYHRSIVVDRTYDVRGAVTAIVRKASRRFGATDHVSLGIAIACGPDAYADVALTWIVPLREAL